MERAWRIEFEGALYHVLFRGNYRRGIFFDNDDRRLILDTMGEMAQRFEIELFAYVLMNKHYHLLLHTPRAYLFQGHAVVRQFGVRTNSQIGEIFGLTGSAVSRRVGVLKSKAVNDKSIRKNFIYKINNRDLTTYPICKLFKSPPNPPLLAFPRD